MEDIKNLEMKKAIKAISPWLSASLSDPKMKPCQEYIDACNLVFLADLEIKIDSNKKR